MITSSLPFVTGVAVQRYLGAEEGLAAAQNEGCSHWYIGASHIPDMPDNWSKARRKELVAAAVEQGLSPVLHGNFRAPLASEIPQVHAASLSYVRTEIELAADLKASALIIHGGAFVEPRPTKAHRGAALDRFLSLLSTVVRDAADKGVEIWLENLSYYPKYRPFSYAFTREADFTVALAQIPRIKFILDVGHANVNQPAAVPIFENFATSIAALSLSNNSGDQDAHLALPDGTLELAQILRVIRAKKWDGIIAFETRNDSVKSGLEYLEKVWESARVPA